MWKEFKRMVLEAAAETVHDQAEKELVVEVWGKLVSQVIGGIKNGFLMEEIYQGERPVKSLRGRAITMEARERTNLLSVHYDRKLTKSLTSLLGNE